MAWIIATSQDRRSLNLQTQHIAAILDRVPGSPEEGSEVVLSSGRTLETAESPAQLLRLIDNEEHPENPPVGPGEAW